MEFIELENSTEFPAILSSDNSHTDSVSSLLNPDEFFLRGNSSEYPIIIEDLSTEQLLEQPPSTLTKEETLLTKWFVKNFLSRSAADELLSILRSDNFDTQQLKMTNFKAMKNEWKKQFAVQQKNLIFQVPQKVTKFGSNQVVDETDSSEENGKDEEDTAPPIKRTRIQSEPLPTIPVKLTFFSISDILSQFLQSKLGTTSLIKSHLEINPPSNIPSADDTSRLYHHPCTGEWFRRFEIKCQSANKIPLAIILFYDPFEAIHQISRGAFMVSIMNLKTKVLLSPISKLPIGLIPPHVDFNDIKAYFVHQILQLEQNGLTIINADGVEQNFMVRVAYAAGDSKDLNGFIGLKGSNALFGCRLCWISNDNYDQVPSKAGIKTKDQLIQIHNTHYPNLKKRGLIQQTRQVFMDYSLFEEGISEMFLIDADFTIQSPADPLHNENLGILMKELTHIFQLKIPKNQIQNVFAEFTKIPTPKGSASLVGRLENMKGFRGNDWRTLAFQLPIVLTRLNIGIGSTWYKTFISHLQYYRILTEKSISEQQLGEFHHFFVDHHTNYKKLYPSDFSHQNNNAERSSSFINFHLGNHYPTYTRFLGAPIYLSLESYEHSIKFMKKAHKTTNGKNPTKDVVEGTLQLYIGIHCSQTYDQFTTKESTSKLKTKTTKVKDSKLQI
jgi:hypothetical protein